MNKHLEASVLKDPIFDESLRKTFLSKVRPDHFFTPDHKLLFRFLQKKWIDDIELTTDVMTKELIDKGLLNIFLDVSATPSGYNFLKNVNYLKKTYLDYQFKLAVEEKDYEQAYLIDQERKKILISDEPFYKPEFIDSELKDAAKNGLNFATFSILNNKNLDNVFKIVKNQTTVLTGIPRSGKTNLADAITVSMAHNYNWRIIMFSPEAQPVKLHITNIYSKYIGKPVLGSGYPADAEWFNDHIKIINTNVIRRELDVIMSIIEEESPDLFILDPWNTIIRTHSDNKRFISESLDVIKEVTYKTNSHALIIAHPTKLKKAESGKYTGWYPPATAYDIDGAAEWWSKPDNVLSLWRPKGPGDVELHIQKVKWEHVLGEVDKVDLKYKTDTGEYL